MWSADMSIKKKIWKVYEADHDREAELAKDLNISEHMAHLLMNRGIDDTTKASKFLAPSQEDMHDPFSSTEWTGLSPG